MLAPIRHEVALMRSHFRVIAPILLHLDDRFYTTVNWSAVDFKVAGYTGSLKEGETCRVTVTLPYEGFDISFPLAARIVRIDEERALAGVFEEVGAREQAILEHFVTAILRGQMDSIDGVLQRIELPVTQQALRAEAPRSPQQLAAEAARRRTGTVLYLLAGIILTVILAALIYTNVFQWEVETAKLTSPTYTLRAQSAGSLRYLAEAGAILEKDAQVFALDSPPALKAKTKRSAALKAVSSHETGKLRRFLLPEGTFVSEGESVALFQAQAPRYVEAYVTRAEAAHLTSGQPAWVYFPHYDRRESYRIAEIEDTALTNQRDALRPIRVRLEPAAPERALDMDLETPAIVMFARPVFWD